MRAGARDALSRARRAGSAARGRGPVCVTAGAMSVNGCSTNARSCMRGCGTVNCGERIRRAPYSSKSRSSVRGALRGVAASRRRCWRRSIACSRASSACGESVVATSATALT